MRRLTIEEGYNRLEWSGALNTTSWFTYSSTLPFKPTMAAGPRLNCLIT